MINLLASCNPEHAKWMDENLSFRACNHDAVRPGGTGFLGGRHHSLGLTPGKQKNGQKPLNPSRAPELGEAAANAPSYLNNVLACSAVVANMK